MALLRPTVDLAVRIRSDQLRVLRDVEPLEKERHLLLSQWGEHVYKDVVGHSRGDARDFLAKHEELVQRLIDWDMETQGRAEFPINKLWFALTNFAANSSIRWFFYGWALYKWTEEQGLEPSPEAAQTFDDLPNMNELVHGQAGEWLRQDKYLTPHFFGSVKKVIGATTAKFREAGSEFNHETLQELVTAVLAIGGLENFDTGGRVWRMYSDAAKITPVDERSP